MKDSLRQVFSLLALCSVLVSLAACQSTPKQNASTANDSTTLAQMAAKQQEHDQLLKEWQSLKPGLERLLAIEEELNLLLGQLEQLSTQLESSQSTSQAQPARQQVNTQAILVESPAPQKAATPPVEAITPVAVPEPEAAAPKVQKVQISNSSNQQAGRYALQVASITEPDRLPEIWQQLQSKHPRLIANMQPNYQEVHVRNTAYYRLKLGRFASRQDANDKCNSLQAAGVNCFVVEYTDSDFAQLVN